MRVAAFSALLGLGLVIGSLLPAEAQQRRRGLVIEAQPRSFLDAGRAVPVGRFQDYTRNGVSFGGLPSIGIAQFNDQALPDRFNGGRGFAVDIQAPSFLAK